MVPLHSCPLIELVRTGKQLDGVTMLVGIAVVGDVTRVLGSVEAFVDDGELVGTHAKQLDSVTMLVGIAVVRDVTRLLVVDVTVVELQFNGTKRKK